MMTPIISAINNLNAAVCVNTFHCRAKVLNQVFPLQFLCHPDLYTEREKSSINSTIFHPQGKAVRYFKRFSRQMISERYFKLCGNFNWRNRILKIFSFNDICLGFILKYSRSVRRGKRWWDKTILSKCWKLLKLDERYTKFNILLSTFAYV